MPPWPKISPATIMKIALLNLQYDNNYGGNLQRYALMKVLQEMGHDVTHLNLRFNFNPDPLHKHPIRILKRVVRKLVLDHSLDLIKEYKLQEKYKGSCSVTDIFYNKYIKHTKILEYKSDLLKYSNYDVYLVGSDQVWRKSIAALYGIDTFFFDFLPDNVQRIAYGVSLGTDKNELTNDDLECLTPLYKKFHSVSVREDSALALFEQYHWNNPQAVQVLDPTLLLSKNDYLELINDGTTNPSEGNMFCYILDPTEEKDNLIKEYEQKKGLKAFKSSLDYKNQMSVQQWLRSFNESDFIITDSYHGIIFSVIFNKPFKLLNNVFRGNARFESLIRLLELQSDTENINWEKINQNRAQYSEKSIGFLYDSLNN